MSTRYWHWDDKERGPAYDDFDEEFEAEEELFADVDERPILPKEEPCPQKNIP